MSVKRRDNKNRILRNGESQRPDGRYAYVYVDGNGKQKFLYSWKLESTDRLPQGKRECVALRDKIKSLQKDLDDGITANGGGLTVLQLVEKYTVQKRGVRLSTKSGYNYIIQILKSDPFGAERIDKVKLSNAKEWFGKLQSDGKSYSTIHGIRGVIKPAFQMAVDDDLIRKNPFDFPTAAIVVNDSASREAITEEQNRLQNCLTVSNIQLGNVVSDTFGKSAQAILDKILENPADTSVDLEPLIHKNLKKKLPELRDAINGYITPEQAGKLKVIKAHHKDLESRKAELEELILALTAPYQQELSILQTAPGISSIFTAIGIISEIGTNMEAFLSMKHLCSWAGFTPTNNESAGKKKTVRVSKAGCYIKPLFVQCANAAVNSNKQPEIRNRYLRLKKRRGHKKAIIAIARMLLTALYHMLKNGENYNAELYRNSELPQVEREITVEQTIIIARNQGYKIKSATA